MGSLFQDITLPITQSTSIFYMFEQGGEGEVVGQLSCIYETITTQIEKKIQFFFIWFLELSDKNKFWKKISQVKEKYH